MCGIIGYIGKNDAINTVISGLEHLEYRGYDSAGIAYLNGNKMEIVKEKGKINNLKNLIDFEIKSNMCIGHTRWATHGEANKINSHPHKVGNITIVHNGIIENYLEIKELLIKNGYKFKSNTDTEIACALLDNLYSKNKNILNAIKEFIHMIKGSYAIGLICDQDKEHIYAIKKDSPLIIGLNENENYIASDIHAILDKTNKYVVLKDFSIAKINSTHFNLYDNNLKELEIKTLTFNGTKDLIDKQGYEHYMLKEIYDQPMVIKNLIEKYKNNNKLNIEFDIKKYKKIDIVACGSAYHAGLIGKFLIENYSNIPVNVEIASEYRYKKLFIDKNTLVIIISQSGETADSLAALKIAKDFGADTLGIVNVEESSIARLADNVIYTEAGCEIAVATTKAYLAQIMVFILLISKDANINVDDIESISTLMSTVINENHKYNDIANKIYDKSNIFYIGRGIDYAISLEGALKLKEISYINAQGYAAGELKHGTISLIDKNTPVIALITGDSLAEKTISNIKEVKARGAYVVAIVSKNIHIDQDIYDELIVLPTINHIFLTLLAAIPLQLIAYMTAKKLNCDIDKPKNLAKSVTVE